jgi:hypothetical protein
MKSVTDEDLILYYYGEAAEVGLRIEDSPELRDRFQALCKVLDSVVEPAIPELHSSYGASVWHRLAPELEGSHARFWDRDLFRPRRQWALLAAMALLVVAAFVTGRLWPRQQVEVTVVAYEGQERILLLSLADHLERSEMLLLELANAETDGELDIANERQLAGRLRSESRLYRQAAGQSGQADVAAVLEQVERVLVEVANSPETISSSDLQQLRMLLEEGSLLFKIRVVGSRVRQEGREIKPPESPEPRALDA